MILKRQGIIEGIMRSFRIGRRIGGRRTLVGLISGAAASLLVLALMPHPVPNSRSQAIGLRRIHQKEDDYTAPKQSGAVAQEGTEVGEGTGGGFIGAANQKMEESGRGIGKEIKEKASDHIKLSFTDNRESSSSILSHVLKLGMEAGGMSILTASEPYAPLKDDKDIGVGHVEEIVRKNHNTNNSNKYNNLTVLARTEALAQMMDVPRTKKESDIVAKAKETALTALQHGFKLTEGQKKLIARMSPEERKSLEARVSKVRVLQEKAYLTQLRSKHQVRPRRGGGEEVISTPHMPVRFPATLKRVHPKDWLPQYKIFLNLTHHPWSNSVICSNFSTTFKPPLSLPRRALASFPSSGNTWIRYLVEGATGLFTGSVYDDSSLTKKGMYGEGILYNSGMTILQKSHGYTTGDAMKLTHEERLTKSHMDELSHQGVIVIRNPFKALISHRHLDTGGHTGYAPKSHFLGKGWAEFVTLKIMLWKDFYMDWLLHSEPQNLHITFYENVKKDAVGEMEKILMYLNLHVDYERLECVGQHTDGLFKRKPSKNVPLDFNPFTQELKDLIYEAIDMVDEMLKVKGKEGLPLSQYEFYDEHESRIARFLRKRRKSLL